MHMTHFAGQRPGTMQYLCHCQANGAENFRQCREKLFGVHTKNISRAGEKKSPRET